jgi:autotransporter-like protein
MAMTNKTKWEWIYVVLALSLLGFTHNVAASLEGSFSGNAKITLECFSPTAGPVTVNGTASLVASGTTATLTIAGSGGDYSYSGTGNISQSATNSFSFDFSGPATIDTGNNTLDGAYTSFVNLNTELSDTKLTIVSPDNVELFVPTPSTNCANIQIVTAISNLSQSNVTTVTANSPSSAVTESVLFNTQIQSTVNDISSRVAGAVGAMRTSLRPRFTDNQFKLEGMTGLNAGDGVAVPYGIWGNYSYTDYENDLSSTAFDGSSHGFLGGIDFGVREGAVLGVAFGYESSDIDTGFNGGNQDTDSFTIAPYFGAILDDTLSVDFNIGYSRVEYDQFRTFGAARVTSSPEADRWFGAFNLNAITFIDNWILGGRVGFLYASSTIDRYTESNGTVVADSRTKVSTANIAGDVSYIVGNFEPFLNLAYQYDFKQKKISVATGPQPSNDRDDILLAAGVRYFEKSGISGNLEYSKRLLRDDFDENRISLTVRVDY